MEAFVVDCMNRVIAGELLSRADLLTLADGSRTDLDDLMYAANAVRRHFMGDEVHFCSIVNAKSGNCSEDCSFCAQSAHFETGINTYGLMDHESMLAAAKEAEKNGASCFGVVTATRGVGKRELQHFAPFFKRLREETGLRAGGSLGFMSPDQAQALADAGMEMVNHNLETSRRKFPEICSTHSYDDRLNTLKAVRDAGMTLCSGVIFGMGEEWEDRVDVLVDLRDLGVESLPLNFLNPLTGTPLEGQESLPVNTILRCIAIARMAAPTADVKLTGGREVNVRGAQALIFKAGASGILVGNYLTTIGRGADEDLQMVRDLGMTVAKPSHRPEPIEV